MYAAFHRGMSMGMSQAAPVNNGLVESQEVVVTGGDEPSCSSANDASAILSPLSLLSKFRYLASAV